MLTARPVWSTPATTVLCRSLTNAETDDSVTLAQPIAPAGTVEPWFKLTPKTFTSTSNYKNHGDYVSSQGGGSDAAHSCIGMPIH